jgi:hypothetical protein
MFDSDTFLQGPRPSTDQEERPDDANFPADGNAYLSVSDIGTADNHDIKNLQPLSGDKPITRGFTRISRDFAALDVS